MLHTTAQIWLGRFDQRMNVIWHREPISLILLIGLVQTNTLGLLSMQWLYCV